MDKIVKLCARRATAQLAAALFTAIVITQSARAAEFIPLGSLPGDRFNSRAHGVSDDGNVVVGFSNGGFVWTRETGMQSIDNVIGVEGLQFNVEDVSGDGSTFVGNYLHGMFRWSEAAGLFVIEHDNQEDGPFHMAESVSADGSAFVGYSFDSILDTTEAFRYSDAGGFQPLGYLPGGGVESQALDISADGNVVVGVSDSANGFEAFGWNEADGMVRLGDIPGGETGSSANAVSSDGVTIVGSVGTNRGAEAYRWTRQDGMITLGLLDDGSHPEIARGVSEAASVIVGDTSGKAAFIWNETDGPRLISDWLIDEYELLAELEGWELRTARGISRDGNHIVGWGVNPNGDTESWLISIPEPSSFVIATVVGACLLLFTRNRKRG